MINSFGIIKMVLKLHFKFFHLENSGDWNTIIIVIVNELTPFTV